MERNRASSGALVKRIVHGALLGPVCGLLIILTFAVGFVCLMLRIAFRIMDAVHAVLHAFAVATMATFCGGE